MSETVDSFLASLESFSSPSLNVTYTEASRKRPALHRDANVNEDIIDVDASEIESESENSSVDEDVIKDRKALAVTQKSLMKSLDRYEIPLHSLFIAPVPARMTRANLLAHQLESLAWMQQQERNPSGPDDVVQLDRGIDTTKGTVKEAMNVNVRGGILADPTGSGKTRAVIALCESEREEPYDMVRGSRVLSRATLIVCRAAAIKEWVDEIRTTVSPTPRILVYCGRVTRCLSVFTVAQEYDYVLTSCLTLQHELSIDSSPPGKLHMIHWKRIVVDDANIIRNIYTQRAQSCFQLSADCRWIVSSSPFDRGIGCLFAYLRFLRVPYFGSLRWWEQNLGDLAKSRKKEKLMNRVLIKALLLRDTVSSLPSISLKIVEVELNEDERRGYERAKQKAERLIVDALHQTRRLLCVAMDVVQLIQNACLSCCIVAESAKAQGDDDLATKMARIKAFAADLENFIQQDQKGSFFEEIMSDLHEQRLGLRECPICYESLLEPAFLRCGHVFCERCICLALSNRDKCPVCTGKVPNGSSPLKVPLALVDANPLDSVLLGEYDKWPPSSKMNALVDGIMSIPESERILVFCSSARYLKYTQWCLQSVGILSEIIAASTKLREKRDILKRFRETVSAVDHPTNRVLLVQLTPKMQSMDAKVASHCFFLGGHWCPTLDKTAISCLRRLGNPAKEVNVVKIIAKNTLEGLLESEGCKNRELGSYRFGVSSALWFLTKRGVSTLFPELVPLQQDARKNCANNQGKNGPTEDDLSDDDDTTDSTSSDDDDD